MHPKGERELAAVALRFNLISSRSGRGGVPHRTGTCENGCGTTIEQGTGCDSEAIGDHVPRREHPAEQQRPAAVSRKASNSGVCTSRNSSTPIAIKPAIDAMPVRGVRPAAIATRKKTIVPHSTEPPYFTMDVGSPRPSPHPRKARPQAMTRRQIRLREIARDLGSSRRQGIGALFFMTATRRPRAVSIRMRFPAPNRAAGSRRHGRPAWRAQWPGPFRFHRYRAAS